MTSSYSWKNIVVLALLSAALNTLPIIIFHVGGDLILYITQTKCFSEQLLSGILYPRWCMEANLGMGSPIPIFYFPLPFYLSSLFYPLRHIDPSLYLTFICSVFTVSAISFIV